MIYGLYKKRALVETSKDILKLYMHVYANTSCDTRRMVFNQKAMDTLLRAEGYSIHPLAVVKLPSRRVKVPSFEQTLNKGK